MNKPIQKSMLKGLDKSLSNFKAALGKAAEGGSMHTLPLANLDSYRGQLRRTFDEGTLKELADSIKDHGVQQPILVRPGVGERYEIIVGERRYRASKIAGRDDIPAIVKHVSDREAEAIHRLENAHRENLRTEDTVAALQKDMKEFRTARAVGKHWNKSEAWVSKMLSLTTLGEVTQLLVSGNITGDSEVLADVNRIEKKDKAKAQSIVNQLVSAPSKANLRSIVRGAKDSRRAKATTKGKPSTPAVRNWKQSDPVERKTDEWPLYGVEIIGSSPFRHEFEALARKHGDAVIAPDKKHKQSRYVWVAFGKRKHLADYPAEELRITFAE